MNISDFLKSQKSFTQNYLSIAIGLGLASGYLLILQAWLLANIINGVIFENSSLSDVQSWIFAMLGVFLLRALLTWSSEIVAFKAAAQVKLTLRNNLHQHLLSLGPIAIDGERSGEIINTLVDGVEALESYYARYLPTMSLVVLIPLSILVFVFPIDWISGVVLLVTAPLIPFFMILIGKGTAHLNKKQWRKMARMSAHFLDMIQGLSTLKIFNASQREADAIKRISADYRKSTMSVLRVAFLSSLVLEFLASVSIAIVAVLVGFRLLYGEIDFFYGFFALLLAPEFYLPLRNMGTHYHARLEAIGAAEKMLDILDKPLLEQVSNGQSLPMTKDVAIEFDNVSFCYGDRGDVLSGFSLSISAGSRVALVGTSGAGKSTVIRLLAGFIQPTQGKLLINGISLESLNIKDWRQQIAWVPQEPHLFQGTIRENIVLGMATHSDEQLYLAAKQAHIDHFIEALPERYDTEIGEKGQGLSGGQIQRIALARAFIKDAPVILLDEATANLDVESEQAIQQAIEQLAQGRTVVMIAHRLATVKNADQIIVMDHGKIIQSGTHQQLLAESGLYAELVNTFTDGI
ncbi:MAG: thiol reductant ABC exporter subunit CydD [Methylophaga sp.]|nr:thiol reductant ABC exporter subunit CydD [Methylophaga sp.]